MNRIVFGIAGLAMAAGTASAAFIGVEIREDKLALAIERPATGLAGFPAIPPRVFNLYAKFDGQSAIDTVLSVGQPDTIVGFGLNLMLNPGANFYQTPGAAGGTTVGGINDDGAGDNRRYWNTFVSIGVKNFGSDYGPIYEDTSSADPDFGMRNTDGLGSPALQANDFMAGGWFNASPPNLQGAAQAGPNGFQVFLGQFSVKDLAPGSQLWSGGGDAPSSATTWIGDIFLGEMTIFRQGGEGEPAAVGTTVRFLVPTPGTVALFGAAGLAAFRRRR